MAVRICRSRVGKGWRKIVFGLCVEEPMGRRLCGLSGWVAAIMAFAMLSRTAAPRFSDYEAEETDAQPARRVPVQEAAAPMPGQDLAPGASMRLGVPGCHPAVLEMAFSHDGKVLAVL